MKKKIIKYLLSRYKGYKRKVNNSSLEHCLDVTDQMLKKVQYCFLISHGENGWSSSRLVQPIYKKNSEGIFTLWIGTRMDLRKTEEIWANPKVTLTFESTKEDAGLVIYGHAYIENEEDIKKRYWKGFWQLFFPEGPKSDEYVALRIEPSHLEILSFSKNIIPEPFGLKAVSLFANKQSKWQLQADN